MANPTSSKRLNVGELDFDGIKNSFKEFLKNQDQFTDYDFEGSGMSVLLDILAYNTHMNGVYANMVSNESFLDSAALRRSLVSIAKQIGYTPRSVQSAKARVNITFGSTRPTLNGNTFDYLPTGTSFRTTFDNDVFNFVTKKPYKLQYNDVDLIWFINDVEITEGVLQIKNFIVNSSVANQKFVLPSERVDISTLVLRVQNSIDDSTGFAEIWTQKSNYAELGPLSNVFFLEEKESGIFQFYFGDGIIGRKPQSGNYITTQFLVTRGDEANGIGNTDKANRRTFDLVGFSNAVVTVTSSASGGSAFESASSIRFNAPLFYQAQNRAVTANDYRSIIASNYGEADSVFVYGGEDADPPQYGKVFVSIKPKEGTLLTDIEKSDIAKNVLANQNVLGIIPEIIDPDYIYLLINTDVTYDPAKTSLSETAVESSILQRVKLYADTELEKFDKNFFFSHFTGFLDDTNDSILGNQTSIQIQKRIEAELNITRSYTIKFNNALLHPFDGYEPILSSSEFTYDVSGTEETCFLDDDGYGNVRIFTLVNDTKTIVDAEIGSVNYTTGEVELSNFKPISTEEEDSIIKITVSPLNQNINTIRNMILLIDDDDITVQASQKTVIVEGSLSGIPFPFNT